MPAAGSATAAILQPLRQAGARSPNQPTSPQSQPHIPEPTKAASVWSLTSAKGSLQGELCWDLGYLPPSLYEPRMLRASRTAAGCSFSRSMPVTLLCHSCPHFQLAASAYILHPQTCMQPSQLLAWAINIITIPKHRVTSELYCRGTGRFITSEGTYQAGLNPSASHSHWLTAASVASSQQEWHQWDREE